MSHFRNLLAIFLLLVSTCQAGTGGLRAGTEEKVIMQPWLVGLTAVVGFLFLVFFILIVKRIFFKKDRNDDEMLRGFEGFDNKALDIELTQDTKMTNL
ncbi:small integral membrane protein 24 [Astyanax mexicanus]|uniref:Small integral membrane protein 24 n=1 Tax=Astyanax mexicanus TaxID=7994 RepID=A0A8T2LGU6_ASTMX|nr:small integral membrane protein 24 [Astyanax mexicanus]